MKLISLVCNHCGGSLDVSPDINFVTCRHCGSTSCVEQVGDKVQLRLVKEVSNLRRQVSHNKLSLALESLDRTWGKKEKHIISNLGHIPTDTYLRNAGILLGLSIAAFLCTLGYFFIFANSDIQCAQSVLGAILFAYASIYTFNRRSYISYWYHAHKSARKIYLSKREEVIQYYS